MTTSADDRPRAARADDRHDDAARAHDPRRLIVFGVVVSVVALLVLAVLWVVRNTIITVYISALFAIGISPLVRMIERQRAIPIGTRVPRWFAILLIYAAIIGVLVGIGMAVMPPLMEQAAELWSNLPEKIDQGQRFLIRMGILRDRITLGEALQQAPKSGATDMASIIFSYVRNVVGGAARHRDHPAVDLLHAGRVGCGLRGSSCACSR